MPGPPPGPRSMITTWSASSSASSSRWVVSRIVTPSALAARNRSQTRCRACGSSPAVGSSRNSSSGRPTSAIARLSRCTCPPDSRRTGVRATVGQAENVQQPVRVERVGRASRDQRAASPRCGPRRARHRTAASPRPAGAALPGRATGRGPAPGPRRRPGRAKPSQTSTVVVLPAPFGPSSASNSPRRSSKDSPSTAVRAAVAAHQPPHRRALGSLRSRPVTARRRLHRAEASWSAAVGPCVAAVDRGRLGHAGAPQSRTARTPTTTRGDHHRLDDGEHRDGAAVGHDDHREDRGQPDRGLAVARVGGGRGQRQRRPQQVPRLDDRAEQHERAER